MRRPTTSARRAATRRESRPRRRTPRRCRGCRTTAPSTSSSTRQRRRSSRSCCRSKASACGARCTASSRSSATATRCAASRSTTRRKRPGLGGEIANPKWQALWRGRKAYDDNWEPRIVVIKGRAGPPDKDPHRVDGLSGATITSNGVTRLMQFWLADDGYGPVPQEVPRRSETVTASRRSLRQAAARHAARRRSSPTTRSACRCSASARRSPSPRALDKALVMGIGVTIVTALREPRRQHGAQLHPEQHPDHRPARDHRLAGDHGRPVAARPTCTSCRSSCRCSSG